MSRPSAAARSAPHQARTPAGPASAGVVVRPASTAAGWRARADLLTLGLGGAILTYVWRIQDIFPVLAAVRFPVVVSLLAWALYLFDRDPRRAMNTITGQRITRLVFIIMALCIASVPSSLWIGKSFGFIRDDLGKNFILMLLVAASIRAFRDLERYVLFLVVGSILYAGFVFLYVHVGASGRLGGIIYYDANDLGMVLVSTLPMALYFLMRGRNAVFRAVALLALALDVLVIIRTGSRGTFLGLLAISLYLLFALSSVRASKRSLVVAAALIALLAFGTDRYWAMMGTILHPQQDYNWAGRSEEGRMEVWKRGTGYMFTHPLLGVGVDAFSIAEGHLSPLAARQNLGRGLKWSAPHSMFVQIGAELGVAGPVLLAMLLWTCFRTLREIAGRRVNPARAPPPTVLAQLLAASVIGYAVTGSFLSQAYAAYAFTLYGLVVGFVKLHASGVAGTPAPARPRLERAGGTHCSPGGTLQR